MDKFMVTIRNSKPTDYGMYILREVVAQGTFEVDLSIEPCPPFETDIKDTQLKVYITEM